MFGVTTGEMTFQIIFCIKQFSTIFTLPLCNNEATVGSARRSSFANIHRARPALVNPVIIEQRRTKLWKFTRLFITWKQLLVKSGYIQQHMPRNSKKPRFYAYFIENFCCSFTGIFFLYLSKVNDTMTQCFYDSKKLQKVLRISSFHRTSNDDRITEVWAKI